MLWPQIRWKYMTGLKKPVWVKRPLNSVPPVVSGAKNPTTCCEMFVEATLHLWPRMIPNNFRPTDDLMKGITSILEPDRTGPVSDVTQNDQDLWKTRVEICLSFMSNGHNKLKRNMQMAFMFRDFFFEVRYIFILWQQVMQKSTRLRGRNSCIVVSSWRLC